MAKRLDSDTLQDGEARLPAMINDSLVRYIESIAEDVRDARFLLHGASGMLLDLKCRNPPAAEYRDELNLRLHTMRSHLDSLNQQV